MHFRDQADRIWSRSRAAKGDRTPTTIAGIPIRNPRTFTNRHRKDGLLGFSPSRRRSTALRIVRFSLVARDMTDTTYKYAGGTADAAIAARESREPLEQRQA